MSRHHYHAVVWIDHHEARVFHFNPMRGFEQEFLVAVDLPLR